MVKSKQSCYHTHTSSLSKIPPKLKHIIVKAKGDSAASNYYWALRDSMVLDSVTEDHTGTTVTLPDKSQILSVKKSNLPIPTLSTTATET